MHLYLATLDFFRLRFSYYGTQRVLLCSMRVVCPDFVLRWKCAHFKNHHHHLRFGFECSFNKVVSKYFELPKHKMGVELIDYTTK